MAYICENELLAVYQDIKPVLEASGIKTEVALIRDYLLKLEVYENEMPQGKLIVDYSPKKRSHSFRKDSGLSEELYLRILGILGVNAPTSSQYREKSSKSAKPNSPVIIKDVSDIPYHAYVDGSFIDGRVGYGAVILENGEVQTEISGAVDSPDAVSSRQVGGEIQAVIKVLEWCKEKGVDRIAIFYDFQNIEKWAVGEYKANTPMTRAYREFIDHCGIDIVWVKVESHTGIALNDRADQLAKEGAKEYTPMSVEGNGAASGRLQGWIVYNGGLLTPKFLQQVEWFVRAANDKGIDLVPLKNDELGVAILNGNTSLLYPYTRKPDFVIFWDKDIRLARQLERLGMRLFNSYKTIYACDDKTLTHQILADNGIPMPKTIFAPLVFPGCKIEGMAFIESVERVLSYPVIVKEAFGSFGAQVYMARNREELLALRERLIHIPHLYQEYVRTSHGRDVRIQVVGDKVVTAMMRTSASDFRANLTAGGEMKPFMPPKEFSDLAIKAARLVRADFAGVDILFGPDEIPVLCEVNSNAHMKNMLDCTGVDVAEKIIDYIRLKLL